MDSAYQFNTTLIDHSPFSLSELRGKTSLIVNTASTCQFSNQLGALERLYQDYKDKGLMVIAVPCDQFGHHEQGSEQEIQRFYSEQYQVSFPILAKQFVNGPDIHPLFAYLKEHSRGVTQNRAIKWNFTKFLIDSQGYLVNRYAPRTKPDTLRSVIESQLDEVSHIQRAKV